jgi:protein phosphatase
MHKFAGKTDPGNREGENEDAIGWDESHQLWLVADGMGGHAAGSVASRIAMEEMLESDPSKPLEDRIIGAHEAIVTAADEDTGRAGMGSTIVVARIDGSDAEISWVGDSRAYLWRRGRLERLTRDHSYLELLRAQNILSEEQIRADPRSNLVIQTLGLGEPRPSVHELSLRYGDWILLCSDGLNDEIEDDEIAAILSRYTEVQGAVDELVQTALDHGGRDNTSVIIVEFRGARGLALYWQLLDSKWLPLIIGATLAALFALLLFVWAR